MAMKRLMAAQLRKPHGWLGKFVVSRVMDHVNRKITEETVAMLEIGPAHDVLEVGFGGGVGLASVLARVRSGTVTGLDVSPDMVRKCEKRFSEYIREGRLRLELGDVCALPFGDRRFDRVFTINTIYFWRDTMQGMREIRRVLKDGGVAAIGLRSKEKMETHGLTRYGFALFSGDDVTSMMEQAGFREIRIDHSERAHWYDQVIVAGKR